MSYPYGANRNDVADVIKWGHNHKIRVNIDYSIMAEYDHRTDNLANRLSPEECRAVIKSIIECDETYRDDISGLDSAAVNNFDYDPNEPFCGVAVNTACMVANGNVYPCPGWQSYVCGNLYEKSLSEIWLHSDGMKKLRALKRGDMKQCSLCQNKAFCSPCPGRFANESPSGNPLEVATHFCAVAEVNKQVVLEYLKKDNS